MDMDNNVVSVRRRMWVEVEMGIGVITGNRKNIIKNVLLKNLTLDSMF